jgi:hypothetical protein
MTGGSILALISGLIALLGPILLPYITVDEEEVSFASYEVLTGQVSILLAIVVIALGFVIYKKRKQALGWVVALVSMLQIGLMAWTYANVWSLVPCTAAGLQLCDDATGGLIIQTLVTLDWGLALVVLASITSFFGGLIAVAAHPEYKKSSRFLKVIMSWDGTIIYEKVMFEPGAVTVGEGDTVMFQLAAKGLNKHTLFAPGAAGQYTLDVPKGLSGTVRVDGDEKKAEDVNSVTVKKGDSGILSFENDVDLAFAFTGAETAVLAGTSSKEGRILGLTFSISAGALLLLLTIALLGYKDRLRNGVEENLQNRQKELIEVTLEETEMTDEEELEGDEDDTTGKKAADEEGKFGDPDTNPDKESKVPKLDAEMRDKIDVKNLGIAKVLGGQQALTGALGTIMAGDTGALTSKMAVAMSGEGGELVIGHGSGGMGFRGTGSGGGGTGGYGRIHGLGAIDTGGGTGRNANVGIGRKKRKRVAKLRLAGGRSTGGCDKGNIAKNVRRRASALRACYEIQLLSLPNLKGKVTMQWTIKQDGAVANPKVVTNSIKNNKVTDCVMRTIKRIRFKKPEAGICVIQWPFVFAPG